MARERIASTTPAGSVIHELLPALCSSVRDERTLRAAFDAAAARLRSEKELIEAELLILDAIRSRLNLAPNTPMSGCSVVTMTIHPAPRQLRLIIETDDFDDAVHFYRDVLGMPEQPAFATTGDDRVSILLAGTATIELATRTHVRAIDTIENAVTPEGPTLRIALEVADTAAAVAIASDAGAEVLAQPTETPFRTINARVQGPSGWQVTFFQETETLQQRQTREGFTTDTERAR